uniref:Putative proclotting enzyme n=1 Tax=Ixodes ricinus TaxID=34613 RepID=A0A0K8RBF7_IXORI
MQDHRWAGLPPNPGGPEETTNIRIPTWDKGTRTRWNQRKNCNRCRRGSHVDYNQQQRATAYSARNQTQQQATTSNQSDYAESPAETIPPKPQMVMPSLQRPESMPVKSNKYKKVASPKWVELWRI